MNLGGNAEKTGVILIVGVHARDHTHAESIEAAGQRGAYRLKSRRGQGVSDDVEFSRGTPAAVRRSAAARELHVTASHQRKAVFCSRNFAGVSKSPS